MCVSVQSWGACSDAGGINAEHGTLEAEPAVCAAPRPVSCVSKFLGMWCVVLEMTLAIHVFNDLKQFTLQLKQDLSCDKPKEILTK